MVDRKFLDKHIIVNPAIQQGKPCLRATRTPVYVILEALAMGMKTEEVKKEYAPLTDDGIRACMLYASLLASEEETNLLSA